MGIRSGIKISFAGTLIEAIGFGFDIIHHLNIGITSPEGLLTPIHFTIFIGFLINFVGILITSTTKRSS